MDSFWFNFLFFTLNLLGYVGPIVAGFFIGRHKYKKSGKKKSMWIGAAAGLLVSVLLLSVSTFTIKAITKDWPENPPKAGIVFSHGKYDIMTTCGFEDMKERESTIFGFKCTEYRHTTGKRNSDFDYLEFYVFKNRIQAKMAFKKAKDFYEDFSIDEDRYFEAWVKDVCDAAINEFVFLDKNMIIIVDTEVYSEWAIDENEVIESPECYPNTDFGRRIKELILSTWK